MKKKYQTPTMETAEAVYLTIAIMSGGNGDNQLIDPAPAPARKSVF